jgi:hypothetical protein
VDDGAGDRFLPLWYWNEPRFDLTKRFRDEVGLRTINEQILSKSVVQHESECLPDAKQLLDRLR